MNATVNEILSLATINVELAASRYGTPIPTLRVSMPKTAHHRHLAVALHQIAADLELAIPSNEGWPVTVETSSDYRGAIVLELLNGTAEEAERAMAVLRKVATQQ